MRKIATFTRTIECRMAIDVPESMERPEIDEYVANRVSSGDYQVTNEDLVIDDIIDVED